MTYVGKATALVVVLLCLAPAKALANPLHERIDQLLEAAHVGPMAGPANDGDFLRRVFLDLVGVVPNAAEVRAFLADQSADKRTKQIDSLLADPRFSRRLANVLDLTLMERRPDKHVPRADWEKYLLSVVRQNKPIHELFREVVAADGADPATRAPAKFFLDRDAEPNLMTRDIGRIFFGRDTQCAQCHDHPRIDDYLQAEYYGIHAMVGRTALFTDAKNVVMLQEKAEGAPTFHSVFEPATKTVAVPQLPGDPPLPEPMPPAGQEYKVKPADKVRPIPTVSRRQLLASAATSGGNRAFNRNLANRLWAMLMGRGIVHPVDFHHSDNPPTHPELLELLAAELVTMKFDAKNYLRQIALTRAYQRSLDLPPTILADADRLAATLSLHQAENRKKSEEVATLEKEVKGIRETIRTADKALTAALGVESQKGAPLAEAQKALAPIQQALGNTRKNLAERREQAQAVSEAAQKAKAAMAKLPKDADLALAAGKIQVRADALQIEVAALVKTEAEQSLAEKSASEKLGKAQSELSAAQSQVRLANESLVATRKKLADALNRLGLARSTYRHSDRRSTSVETLVAYAAAARQFDAENAKWLAGKERLAAAHSAWEQATAVTGLLEQARAKRNETVPSLERSMKALETEIVALQSQATRQANGNLTKEIESRRQAWSRLDGEKKLHLSKDVDLSAVLADRQAALVAAKSRLDLATAEVTHFEGPAKKAEVAYHNAREKLTEQYGSDYAIASLKPMSPEQFGWSVLQATGVTLNYRSQALSELNKPVAVAAGKPAQAKPPATLEQVEDWIWEKLAPATATFVSYYAATAGQPQDTFFATVDQALFVTNNGVLPGWLGPAGDNLVSRALRQKTQQQMAEEVYLSTLARYPTPEESADAVGYLSRRPKDLAVALQEIAWALLASVEFRFNH